MSICFDIYRYCIEPIGYQITDKSKGGVIVLDEQVVTRGLENTSYNVHVIWIAEMAKT